MAMARNFVIFPVVHIWAWLGLHLVWICGFLTTKTKILISRLKTIITMCRQSKILRKYARRIPSIEFHYKKNISNKKDYQFINDGPFAKAYMRHKASWSVYVWNAYASNSCDGINLPQAISRNKTDNPYPLHRALKNGVKWRIYRSRLVLKYSEESF